MGEPVACYASMETWSVLRKRFDYVFEGTRYYPPICTATVLDGPMQVGEVQVTPFVQNHGNIDSTGYRFDAAGRALAYSTDVKRLDGEATLPLSGLDLWVVDALRRHPHPTHSHLSQTLEWIDKYRPRQAVLTHMDQSMDYMKLVTELPAGVIPGHDGLVVDLKRF
jgi:phosphoribosyl 1,2-cyclic phosphate phosphodiesterase